MNSNRIFRDVKEKILSTGSVKTWKSYRSALKFFFGYFYGYERYIGSDPDNIKNLYNPMKAA